MNTQPRVGLTMGDPAGVGPELCLRALNHREALTIREARARGIAIEGPLPPDAAFTPDRRKAFDGIVCLYQDQGHISFKMLSFDDGVNVTLGLPIVRTSVDHGTAFDIAWRGVARPNSLFKAIECAVRPGGLHNR